MARRSLQTKGEGLAILNLVLQKSKLKNMIPII